MTEPLPFRVRLGAYPPGGVGTHGWLTIDTDSVTFEWSGLGRALSRRVPEKHTVHARLPVGVFKASLHPPFGNSGLILRGEDGPFVVATFWGKRKPVLRALAAAHIPIVELHTWFSLGTELARNDDWAPH
jgi:hypothetical protein